MRIHRLSSTNNYFITFLGLIIGTTLLFVILQPQVSSLLFKVKRDVLLNNYIQQIDLQTNIDPQAYWMLREFYSPGYFTLNKTGLANKDMEKIRYDILVVFSRKLTPILTFQSPKSLSVEFLTTYSNISSFIKRPEGAIIIKNNNREIIYKSDTRIVIALLLRINEMKKANGFFDYTGDDKEFLKGKYWLTVTSFITN